MAACPSCGVALLVVSSEPVANKKRKVQQSVNPKVDMILKVLQESVESFSSDLSQAFNTKQESELSLNEASSLFSERERAHNEVVARLGAAAGTKLELELAISSKFELDVLEGPERQAKLASFKTQIESLVKDSNLSNAVLMSLGKESEACGTLDTMVLQQLDSELTELLEQVTHDIESGDEEQVKSQELLAAGELAIESAKDSLIAVQKGVFVALAEAEKQKQVSEKVCYAVPQAEKPIRDAMTGQILKRNLVNLWMKQHQPTPQAVEETVPQDVSMAPADVALPVASDKTVSTHAVNVAALSPQAGA